MVQLLGAPFPPRPLRKDGDGAAPASAASGPTQTDVHVDAILSPLKPKKRKRKYRAPFFKGEADGHAFRGNQYTGGIDGPGSGDAAPSSARSSASASSPRGNQLGETRSPGDLPASEVGMRLTAFRDVKVGDVLASGQKVTKISFGSIAGFLYTGPNDSKRYDLDEPVQIRVSAQPAQRDPGLDSIVEQTTKIAQSVHERGGTNWRGEEVKPIVESPDINAAIATKIDINARTVDRLTREMATDTKFGDWATTYAAKVGTTRADSTVGRQTWAAVVGFDNAALKRARDAANDQFNRDATTWTEQVAPTLKLKDFDGLDRTDMAINLINLKVDREDQLANGVEPKYQRISETAMFYLSTPDEITVVPQGDPKYGSMGWGGHITSLSREEAMKRMDALPPAPRRKVVDDAAYNVPLPKDGRVIALAAKVRSTIDTWAGSSGDTTVESIALQRAVADHFAMTAADEAPLKQFADDAQRSVINSPNDIDVNQFEYWDPGDEKPIEELKVGEKIFNGETVTKIDPPLDSSETKDFYVISSDDNGTAHSYTIWGGQNVNVDNRTDAARAEGPTNTAWKIAGRMLDDQRPFYEHFVQAVYDNTQAELKKAGATELLLYRGMHINEDFITPAIRPPVKSYDRYDDGTTLVHYDTADAERAIAQQPLSSWSADESIAEQFAGNGSGRELMLAAVVPAARVWGLASGTGVGCLNEREVVVLGGPGTARVTWNEYGWTQDHIPNDKLAEVDLSHAVDETPKPGDPDPVADWLNANADKLSLKKSDDDRIAVDAELVNADWIKHRSSDVSSDGTKITPVVARDHDKRTRTIKFVKVGEAAGHAFRGNQYISGQSGGDGATSDEGGSLAPTTSPPSSAVHAGAQAPAQGGREVVPITAADTQGRGRAVSLEEFHALAREGQAQLAAMAEHASPHVLADPKQLAVHIAAAYAAATKSWGGVTIDAHTGKTIPDGAMRYAVTTKPPGMKTVALDEHASRAQFAHAYKIALSRFSSELDHAQAHLGVFHDDDKHRIDIDPVTVVDNLHDVETIGAASHAIGGAYCFADGNGYFPPHVADAELGAKVIPLHKPPQPATPQIHKPLALVKGAPARVSHAQFRAQRPDADDVDLLPLELLDDDEDNASVPLIPVEPLAKAGEGPDHPFRGNQYEDGESGTGEAGTGENASKVAGAVSRAQRDMGEPKPKTYAAEQLQRISAMQDDEAVNAALTMWRSSFMSSTNMRAISMGGTPAPAYQRDYYMHTMAHLLTEAVKTAPVVPVTWRAMRQLKPGDTYNQGLMAVALDRRGASEYIHSDLGENTLYRVEGAPVLDMTKLEVPSREGLTAGVFRYVGDDNGVRVLRWEGFGDKLAKAGEGPDHPFRGNQYEEGQSDPDDPGALLSPHALAPEPARGRAGARPDNPHATELDHLTPELAAAITAKVLKNSPDPAHPLTPEVVQANLMSMYKEAVASDAAAVVEGKSWYNVAKTKSLAFGHDTHIGARAAIGMTAALSPQAYWEENIAMAALVARKLVTDAPLDLTPEQLAKVNHDVMASRGGKLQHMIGFTPLKIGMKLSEMTPGQAAAAIKAMSQRDVDTVEGTTTATGEPRKFSWSTGLGNVTKAVQIFRGEDPDAVLAGHKVRSFFNNIADPNNDQHRDDVTIDTHAVSAAAHARIAATSPVLDALFSSGLSNKAENTLGTYAYFADAYRQAAAATGLTPNQFQAVVWIHWRHLGNDSRFPDYEGANKPKAKPKKKMKKYFDTITLWKP